jgi:hypothetical protein
MCWESHSIPELKIASEDIPVFKVVKKDHSAYYQPFYYYSLNMVYTTNLGTPLGYIWMCQYQINEGFHSYSTEKCKVITLNGDSINTYISVLYNNIRLDHYVNATVMKCVIPKGAQYYLNNRGEYVSNKIKPICVGQ